MRAIGTLLLTSALSISAVEMLAACGDKFIRIGREARYGRYVAVHPAQILIYGPEKSAPSRLPELPGLLKRAGHSVRLISRPEDLGPALRAGNFDLILTGMAHADDVARQARAVPSHPDVMPVLIEPRAAESAAAKTLSPCMINVPFVHKNDALAEIDHRMELRLKAAGATGGRP
jgi:hypothetical protein